MSYAIVTRETVIHLMDQEIFELENLIKDTPMIFAPIGTKKRFMAALEQLKIAASMLQHIEK